MGFSQKITLLLLVVLHTLSIQAASDACYLETQALPSGLNMTEAEIQNYRIKLRSECVWKQNYDQFNHYLQSTFQLSAQRVTEYEAMRFIRRVDFENAKNFNVPVEKTYQVNRSQYDLPDEQKSSVIWDNWVLGMRNLEPTRQELISGQVFDLNKLKKIHEDFFQLSTETGDHATIPYQGKLKTPQMTDKYWWELFPAQLEQGQKNLARINQEFTQLGLASKFTEPYLNKILDIRQAVKRQSNPDDQNKIEYIQAIYSGQSRAIEKNINNVLGFLNSIIQQGLRNQNLIWQNKVYTPAEAAYIAQKFFVAVHPFHEGNGRTSRFMQELILTSLNMPHGSSGELMDQDVLTTQEEYYQLAMTANAHLMQTLQSCVAEYNLLNGINPAVAQQGLLNYSCRIINNTRP